MKTGKTCGVYVVRSGNRRRAYVGESSAIEDRDTYRIAKLLGWPATIVRVLPHTATKTERAKAESEVAKQLQEEGIWVVSNARGLVRRQRMRAALAEMGPYAVLRPGEVAALLGVNRQTVACIPHMVVGKRTKRYFARDVLAYCAGQKPSAESIARAA